MQGILRELFSLDLTRTDLPPGTETDWAEAENGCRWAVGRRSHLSMPRPQIDTDVVIVLTVDPFCCAALPHQLLRVVVNETTVRLARFSDRAVVACLIRKEMLAGRERLELRFEHPHVIQPNMISNSTDSRGYSVGFVGLGVGSWTEAETQSEPSATVDDKEDLPPVETLSDEQLMLFFASLGDNCEFGMAQRYAKAEPLDLLRFAGMPIENLIAGVSNGFKDIDRLDDLQFKIYEGGGRREYVLQQRTYDLQSHTQVDEGRMSLIRLLGRERKKLEALSRLFRSDLADARRIFVFKRNDVSAAEFAMPLYRGLRQWGPNTLLHVVQGDPAHRPGDVEIVADGFLRGYIDRFNGYDNAAAAPSPIWIDLCRNSYTIWRERGWRR